MCPIVNGCGDTAVSNWNLKIHNLIFLLKYPVAQSV
jgi:hypothetical protein